MTVSESLGLQRGDDAVDEPHCRPQAGEWVALELWNDTAWPRCTCMDITFGLSEKESFCHKDTSI